MIVIPDIFELLPQTTIVIIPPEGSVIGHSEKYNLIVKLRFESISDISVGWVLTVINRGFYRFGNKHSEWSGTNKVALSDKVISIPFVIQNIDNISKSTPDLCMEIGIYEEQSGSESQRFDHVFIKVSYQPILILKGKLLS